MKGVVFTEFLEMVEARFSPALVEELIVACDPPSGGAYTSIGTYDHRELVALVGELARRTEVPAGQLVYAFGRHLLRRFTVGFPLFFAAAPDTFAFLERVEGYVHSEVRKLYPDAELPTFVCRRTGDNALSMTYRSSRGLADLAHGLIEGCAEFYGERIEVTEEDLSGGRRMEVRFLLRKVAGAAA